MANHLRLLGLPEKVQDMVMEGLLLMGQVRPIINHKDCVALAQQIVKKGLSARQAEALAKRGDGSHAAKTRPEKSADIRDLEDKASASTGVTVMIEWDEDRDNGSVHLKNCSREQLETVLLNLGAI